MLEWFETVIGPAHAAVGFVGLAAFWVPIFARKGGGRHVLFGRIFANSAYVTLALAGFSVVYHMGKLLAQGIAPASDPAAFSFLLFLGYLALVTFINVRHAVGVLRTKKNPAALRTGINLAMGRLALLASVVLIGFALYFRPPGLIVLLALSPFGLSTGFRISRHLSTAHRGKHDWLYQHMGGMLSAGIAYHTAFAVFGSTQLIDYELEGLLSAVPWILPAAVGVPTIGIWIRHYRQKFGDLKSAPATAG